MPYGYLTDPSLARDFWAIYTVEPTSHRDADRGAENDTRGAAKKAGLARRLRPEEELSRAQDPARDRASKAGRARRR